MDPDNSGLPGSSGERIVTRRYLFVQMQQQKLPNFEEKLNYLESHLLSGVGYTESQIKKFKHKFSHFKSEMKQRWSNALRKEDIFLKNNESWLDGTFETPLEPQSRPGRPQKLFEESSERTKRRKTEEIRATVDEGVIIHAAKLKLQTSGKRDASQILKEISSSPSRARKYKRAYSQTRQDQNVQLTPLQALSMYVEADLTRRQYEVIRNTNKKMFPSYTNLQKAKQECYPPKESYRVTSTCAETNLQSLIDHTVTRLCEYLKEVLITLNQFERDSLKIICKWGCDGSQQQQFKQKFENCADSDANIFLSSFVPLQIVCGKDKKIVWRNPTPSSPRFCRPIRFRFLKETTDITVEEISYVRNSAKSLAKTVVQLDGNKYTFEHSFTMTMVDAKVCNAATSTKSTNKCYICGATSKDFNKLNLKKQVDEKALEFGLSVLHARIRFLESILHLAYKLPVGKYRQSKTESEKATEAQRKKYIQERFRVETGLLLDRPRAGFGNTNDGNTSRRFFDNPQLAAEITGISYELLYRLKVILETISSGYEINTEKYDKYAFETAKLYVELYSWHPMTPTLHKILMYGAEVIKNALLPIGQLSEEAAEARNKHFRSYRQNFARKFSRESCNLDIYNRLLLSSDPLLSSIRQIKKRKMKTFLPETIELLISAEPNTDDDSIESDEVNVSPMESEEGDSSEDE